LSEQSVSGGLTGRTIRAARWRLGASLVGAVFQFVTGVVLARLLTPADFGIMALAFAVLGLTTLFGDFGMGGAVVQWPRLTERHVRTAFTFSVVLGLTLTLLVAATAPLGAALMREPKLALVLRVLAVGFVVRSFAVVANALLRRQLDFRRLFFAELGSYVLAYAGIAVTLAMLGFGVWSLVWGGLLQSALSSLILLSMARHPMRPFLGRRELRDLLHFGVGSTANAFVNYAATSGDNFVAGRWIGATGLGLYSRAYSLMNLPYTYMSSVISGVLFPAFAQTAGEVHRLRRGYLLASRLTALAAAPIMGGMAVAAPHLIRGLYGRSWNGSIVPLQILCIAGYFRALYHLGGSVTQASGQVYRELRAQVGYALLVVGGCIAASRFGLPGIAGAVAFAILYMYVAMAVLALGISGVTWRQYLSAQGPGVGLGILVALSAAAVRASLERLRWPSAAIALSLVIVCGVIWAWVMLVVLYSQDMRVISDALPVRLQSIASIPSRVHRRLRVHYSLFAHR
jgi:O-antigen/teichoic acid export membrane protein